jgi:hypothetical protein
MTGIIAGAYTSFARVAIAFGSGFGDRLCKVCRPGRLCRRRRGRGYR